MKKILFLFLILSLTSLQAETIDKPPQNPVSRSEAIFRSLLFPGWGQMREQPDKWKGYLFANATWWSLVGVTGAVIYRADEIYDYKHGGSSYNVIYLNLLYNNRMFSTSYNNLLLLDDYIEYRHLEDNVHKAEKAVSTSLSIVGGIYLLSLIDVILFKPSNSVSQASNNVKSAIYSNFTLNAKQNRTMNNQSETYYTLAYGFSF